MNKSCPSFSIIFCRFLRATGGWFTESYRRSVPCNRSFLTEGAFTAYNKAFMRSARLQAQVQLHDSRRMSDHACSFSLPWRQNGICSPWTWMHHLLEILAFEIKVTFKYPFTAGCEYRSTMNKGSILLWLTGYLKGRVDSLALILFLSFPCIVS